MTGVYLLVIWSDYRHVDMWIEWSAIGLSIATAGNMSAGSSGNEHGIDPDRCWACPSPVPRSTSSRPA